MTADFKIEIFAYNLFHNLWHIYKVTETVTNIREVYGDECSKVNDYMEVLDNQYDNVILVRRSLFKNVYRNHFTDEIAENLKSPFDFYDYVCRICDRDDLFGHLTVFQRVFATITFVVTVCLRMHESEHIIDIVKYGHMIWVMYFDKFKEEFYERGDWKRLQIESKSYEYLFEFNSEFKRCTFFSQNLKQATTNYFRFRNVVDCQEQQHNNPIYISKQWIKFHIAQFDSYVNVPVKYEVYINAYEAEVLLEDLQSVFPPSRSTSNYVEISEYRGETISSAISYSELHYTSEEMEANDTGVHHPTFEHESRDIDKVPDEFSNIYSGFENRIGKNCAISEQEVLTLDTTHKNENFEFQKNGLSEMELPKQTSSVDSTKNFHIDQNLLPVVNINKRSETSNEKSTNTAYSDHGCRGKSFINECDDDTIENFRKGNIEEQKEIPITSQEISVNKIDENASPVDIQKTSPVDIQKTSPVDIQKTSLKDFRSVNENVSRYHESEKTRKAREDLRKEQRDPEMKNFLKMLLVLDDKEDTKFVLSMLQNNEEGPEILQESSNKQKKRPKKKKNRK